jgi:hypothetical protein
MRVALVLVLAGLSAAVSPAIAADAHIGFDIAAIDGSHPEVTRVYAMTHAQEIGIRPGMRVLSVAGGSVKDGAALERKLAKKKPGDKVVVKVRDGENDRNAIVRLVGASTVEEQVAREQAAADAEKKLRESEERMLAAMDKMDPKHGSVLVMGGAIVNDVLGDPKLEIELCNVTPMRVDAVEIRVELFDKFDRPVNGIFGASNEKTFLHQTELPARAFRTVTASIPFHETTGRAKVSVTKYVHVKSPPMDVEVPLVRTIEK